MAKMTAAKWVGPHHDNGLMQRYDIVCLHTIVGHAPAHAAHFSTDGDGTIFQSRDTKFASAANLNGNHRIIAIENEDHGPHFPDWNTKNGHAVPAFTNAQIEAIAKICAWAHKKHGIPLVACPNSKPGSRGIAFHRQGIGPNNFLAKGFDFAGVVAGGEIWSGDTGKVCPGDRRIKQIPKIIARAREIAGGEDWFDMATKADLESVVSKKLTDVHKKLNDIVKTLTAPLGESGPTPRQALADAAAETEMSAAMANLKTRLDEVDAKLDKLIAGA